MSRYHKLGKIPDKRHTTFKKEDGTLFQEELFGILTQLMGLRKINTIGIGQANKIMHLSAMAYNLKKYLKFIDKKVRSDAKSLAFVLIQKLKTLTIKRSTYKGSKRSMIFT